MIQTRPPATLSPRCRAYHGLRLLVCAVLLLALSAPRPSWADSLPVLCTVVQPSESKTPGAPGVTPAEGVTVVIKETGQSETTDAMGAVRFKSVPEGDLTFVAAKPGFGQTIKQYTLKGPLPGNVLIYLSAAGVSSMNRPAEKPDTVYVAFSGITQAHGGGEGNGAHAPLSGPPITNMGTLGMIANGQDPFTMGANGPATATMPGTAEGLNPTQSYQTNTSASENTIMMLDPEQPTKARFSDTPSRSYWMAFNSAGTKLFVSNDKQCVQVYDVTNNNIELASIPAGGVVTDLVRANSFIYASVMGNNPGILVIDPQRVAAIRMIPIPSMSTGQRARPRSVAVNADGTRLFVALDGDLQGEVAVVDAFTTRVLGFARVGAQPLGIALTPDNRYILCTSARTATVSVVDAYSLQEVSRVSVGVQPARIAIRPDGTKAYVTCKGSNAVHVISLQTMAAGAVIPVGTAPMGLAITSNGARVFVGCNGNGTVSILDAATDTFVKSTTPQPRSQPYGVAVKP